MKEYFISTLINIFDTYFIVMGPDVYEINKNKTLDEKFNILSGLTNISLIAKVNACTTIDDEINLLYKVFAYTRKTQRNIRVTLEAKKEYIQICIGDHYIQFYYAGANLEPTMVTLNHSAITTFSGATFELVAKVFPEGVIYNALTWISSDESVATVDQNGKVEVLTSGTCAITVKTTNGKYAVCQITSMVNISDIENDIRVLKNDILLINGKQQEFADLLDSINTTLIGNIEIVDSFRAELDDIKSKLTEIEVYESNGNINIKTNNVKIYG